MRTTWPARTPVGVSPACLLWYLLGKICRVSLVVVVAIEDGEVARGAAGHHHRHARADLDAARGRAVRLRRDGDGADALAGVKHDVRRHLATRCCGAARRRPRDRGQRGRGLPRQRPLRRRHVLAHPGLEMAHRRIGAVGAGMGAAVAPAHHAGLQRLAGMAGDEDRPATVAVACVGAALGIAGAEDGVGRNAPREGQEGVADAALGDGNLGPEQRHGDLGRIRLLVRPARPGDTPSDHCRRAAGREPGGPAGLGEELLARRRCGRLQLQQRDVVDEPGQGRACARHDGEARMHGDRLDPTRFALARHVAVGECRHRAQRPHAAAVPVEDAVRGGEDPARVDDSARTQRGRPPALLDDVEAHRRRPLPPVCLDAVDDTRPRFDLGLNSGLAERRRRAPGPPG